MPLRTPWAIAAIAGVAFVTPRAAIAGFVDPRVSYTLHHFSDVDGVSVSSHYAFTGVRMTNDVDVSVRWGHDIVVFPAIQAPPGSQDAVDAITTASRPIGSNADPFQDFVKARDEIEGTVTYRRASASYYVSKESDYFAQMVSANYSHDFLNENLTLSAGVSFGWDDIQPLDDDDTEGIPDYRETLHGNLIATQVLTPTTVLRVGGEVNRVRGLQHDPYRNVYVAGGNVPEAHPKQRDRWDIFMRVSQYLNNRSSIRLEYRYYEDDWGVSSHTYGGKLSQYVTDSIVVRYRYRYYAQAPAFFFREEYTLSGGIEGFRTNDYRLGNYGAHLFGGQLAWYPYRALGISWLDRAQLTISYEHYFNSNNFSANIVETGLGVTF